MTKKSKYRLLCPISRALDRVGDRWTLLILRDLHAGPARFKDIQTGLPGLAPNLLTTRLEQLQEDGLIQKRAAEFEVQVYELTEVGAETDQLLFALATFGGRFTPDKELRRPGNLRNIAVTLQVALGRALRQPMELLAALKIDDEVFSIRIQGEKVTVRAGAPLEPEFQMHTSYEPMMATVDGTMSLDKFAAKHVKVEPKNPKKATALMELLSRAMPIR